jgi:pantothenate kinase
VNLDALVDRATALTSGRRRALLGIAGAPGAGKTTLAQQLVDAVNTRAGQQSASAPFAVLVPMDGFHLADVELRRQNLLSRKGAPETFDAAGYVALLRRLRAADEDVTYAPAFERQLEQPLAGAIAVQRAVRLVVTEGNYLLLPDHPWTRVRALLDEAWMCQADDDVRRHRLVARHVAYGKSPADAERWVAKVDEPNALLVEQRSSQADVVVEP